jgi:hypothetical protein
MTSNKQLLPNHFTAGTIGYFPDGLGFGLDLNDGLNEGEVLVGMRYYREDDSLLFLKDTLSGGDPFIIGEEILEIVVPIGDKEHPDTRVSLMKFSSLAMMLNPRIQIQEQ